jgi:hypothetical protein
MYFQQLRKFLKFAGYSTIPYSFLERVRETYAGVVDVMAHESVVHAIHDEVAATTHGNDEDCEPSKSMAIQTDARHATRKNARYTDHIALGQITHKVRAN